MRQQPPGERTGPAQDALPAFRDVAWEHDQAKNDYHRIAEEGHEHLAIVEVLLENDGKSASKAMASHIRSGIRYWTRGRD